jgi:hypothetical protein
MRKLAMQRLCCFEAGGLTQTQSSAEVTEDTGYQDLYLTSSAANGCLVA